MMCDGCSECNLIKYAISMNEEEWKSLSGKTVKDTEYITEKTTNSIRIYIKIIFDDDSSVIAVANSW